MDNFEKMVWTQASIEDGEEVESAEVSYQNMGRETVDGTDTELLVFNVDGEELKFWAEECLRKFNNKLIGFFNIIL